MITLLLQFSLLPCYCSVEISLLLPPPSWLHPPILCSLPVNQVGVPVLKEILQDLTIPDISGTTKVKALASITIDYTVSK